MTRVRTVRILGLICLSLLVCVWFGLRAERAGAAASSDSSDSSDAALSLPPSEDSSSTTKEEEEEAKKKQAKKSLRSARTKQKEGSAKSSSESSEAAPSSTQPKATAAPETKTVIPAAPTAAPSAAGAGTGASPPVDYGLIPPTGFGGYEGALPMKRQAAGAQGNAAGMTPNPFGPYVTPPTPTQSASEGAAGTDPTLGRYSSYAVPQATGQLGVDQRPAVSPPAVTTKPFADYRPPEAMSPYMNLYRSGVTGIDNYNALVKPVLEQQQRDMQTQHDLANLQRASSVQGANLQQINQRINPYQQGASPQQGQSRSPATFMNFQRYYPGFKR